MEFELIKTEHLILRKLTPEVYHYVFANYVDEELVNFFALSSGEELAKEKEKYERGISTHNRSFVFFQVLDIHSGNYIGWCGFHTWYTEHQRAEVGYVMTNEAYRGRGLMSEALEAVLRYGFEHMGLNRVEAFIGPGNVPSLKLAGKSGFTKEGHMRQHYSKNGKIEDSLVFSILKEEYDTKIK